jgi:hypothetical protein
MSRTSRWRAPLALLAVAATATGTVLLVAAAQRPTNQLAGAMGAGLGLLLGAIVLVATYLLVELHKSGTAAPGRGQRIVFGAALLALLASGSLYSQLDSLLLGFHRPGEPAFGLRALASLALPTGRATTIQEAIASWHGFAAAAFPQAAGTRAAGSDAPLLIVSWALGIDTGVLAAALVAVLGLLIVWEAKAVQRMRGAILRTSTPVRIGVYRRLANFAVGALIVGAAADVGENWTALVALRSGWFQSTVPTTTATILGFLTLVKVAGYGLAVGYVALLGLVLARNGTKTCIPWQGLPGALRTVVAIRLQLAVLALLSLALLLHEQVPDVIRRWSAVGTGPAAVALTLVLAAGMWHSSWWMLVDSGRWHSLRRSRLRMAATMLLATVLGGALLAAFGMPEGWRPGWGFAVLAGLVVTIAVLSLPVWQLPALDHRGVGWGAHVWPSVLASAVITVVGLAVLRSAGGDFFYLLVQGEAYGSRLLLLTVALLLLVLAGLSFPLWRAVSNRFTAPRVAADAWQPRVWPPAVTLVASVILWAALAWVLSTRVLTIAPALGAIAVLLAFSVLLVYFLTSLAITVDRLPGRPAPLFAAVGLRRTPVVSLLVLWWLVVTLLPFNTRLHDVLADNASGVSPSSETLDGAMAQWTARNCLTGVKASGELPAVPLVLVASSGGGIRAAVWTASVLDQALGYPQAVQSVPGSGTPASCNASDPGRAPASRSSRVFAVSGVSGGSLGIAAWAARLTSAQAAASSDTSWLRSSLNRDFLAPALAWMLFVETPWSLLHFDADRDRAAVLEESWQEAWPAEPGRSSAEQGLRQGLFALRASHQEVPLLVFNGTSVESGCRFNASVLDSDGREQGEPTRRCVAPLDSPGKSPGVLAATVDLKDFICRGDIPLAKAVLLSARFPVISPSGHLKQCTRGQAHPAETFVVDGGYLENSGAATINELWTGITPLVEEYNRNRANGACIVPFLIQIDNGYGEPAPVGATRAVAQFRVPLATAQATRNAHAAAARQAARLTFDRPFDLGRITVLQADGQKLPSRYVRFSMLAHPGARAPLGWTLSRQSFNNIRDQLQQPQNLQAASQVQGWFSGLRCQRSAA